MADATHLKDLYLEELGDLWSANDQMTKAVDRMVEQTGDERLKEALKLASKGIREHAEMLKAIIADAGGNVEKEHCKGMEGLVTEAYKHAIEADLPGPLKDVAIISQYQRMCHYGIAGFGTAKAYAEALGRFDDAQKLEHALDRVYASDEFATRLAERSKNLEAA